VRRRKERQKHVDGGELVSGKLTENRFSQAHLTFPPSRPSLIHHTCLNVTASGILAKCAAGASVYCAKQPSTEYPVLSCKGHRFSWPDKQYSHMSQLE